MTTARAVRTNERAFLDSQLNCVSTARAVLILGDAGIGKTHLLEEFLTDAEITSDVVVMRADPPRGPNPRPYAALLDLIHNNWNRIETTGADKEGARLAAAVRDNAKAREILRLFDEFMARITKTCPVVLTADHVVAQDRALLDAFAHVLRRNRDKNLLVTVTARPTEHVAELFLEATDAIVLPIEALTENESRALLTALATNGSVLDEATIADVISRAAGNPLFLIELASAHLTEQRGSTATTVRLLLAARLDHLDAPARAIVETTALCGRTINYRFAMLANSLDPDEKQPLTEAIESGLLIETDSKLAIHNPLIAELVGLGMSPATRRKTHQRIANILALLDTPATEIAHHALAGSLPNEPFAMVALTTAREAATSALLGGTPQVAVDIVDRALALEPPPELETELLTLQAEAFLNIGDTTKASTRFETVLRRGRSEDALLGLARSLQRGGHLGAALDVFEQCEGHKAHRGRAEVLLGLGRSDEAWDVASHDLDQIDSNREPAQRASALANAALAAAVRMMPEAVDLGREAVTTWEQAGEDSLDWPPLFALGLALESADLYDESLSVLRRLRNWLDVRGLLDSVPRVARTEAIAAFCALSWARMSEAIAAAIDARRDRPNHEMGPIWAAMAALGALRGDDDYQRVVDRAHYALDHKTTPFDRALTDWWLGIGQFMSLDIDAALTSLKTATDGFRAIGATDFLARTLPLLGTASAVSARGDRERDGGQDGKEITGLASEYRQLTASRPRPSVEADLLVLQAAEAVDAATQAALLVRAAQAYSNTQYRFGMLAATVSAWLVDRSLVPSDLIAQCTRCLTTLGDNNAVCRLFDS